MPVDAIETRSDLSFHSFYVTSIQYIKNERFIKGPVAVQFGISSKFQEIDSTKTLVLIECKIFENPEKNNFPFSLYVSLTGEFSIEAPTQSVTFKQFEANAIAILFPYLRALVTTITANSNVAPLILPPINVMKLIHEQSMAEGANATPAE